MRRRVLVVGALALAGCGAGGSEASDAGSTDAPVGADAMASCAVFLTFDPPMTVASPQTQVRAIVSVLHATGIVGYTWEIKYANAVVTHQLAQADGSQVMFDAPDAGVYSVFVDVDAPGQNCPTAQVDYNVAAPNSNTMQVRLRVTPSTPTTAPPQERLVLVNGGAGASLNLVSVDPGVSATGHVRSGTTAVPAYLRFIPLGARDGYVETFTTNTGAFSARVLNTLHDVLVVPTIPGFAPHLVRDWSPGTTVIPATPGSVVSGFVAGPGGAGLDGAKVQITVAGIPSTLATTTNGNFSVRSIATTNSEAIVDVAPPLASGLPRITATSSALNLGATVQVAYASLTLRDLGGVLVRRDGAPVASAPVTVVGTLADAGTVSTGTTSLLATGTVRIATSTNASGELPSTLVPAAPLTAVTVVTPGDLALDAIDLTTSVPAQINAPAMATAISQIRDPAAAPIRDAVLEAVPLGALKLAGAATLRVSSQAGGTVTLALPANGRYDIRVSDPGGRGAAVLDPDVAPSAIQASYALATAVRIIGSLQLQGSGAPVGNAAVQILCTSCTGVARSRPLGETSSTSSGGFDVAVPDPGTM